MTDNSADGATPIDFDESVEIQIAQPQDAGLPEERELSSEEEQRYKGLMEAVLFMASEPLSVSVLARRCNLDRTNTRYLADQLIDDYDERDGGIVLREIAGGYRMITAERFSENMKNMYREQKRETLSRSALETLSIISYKQPITLPEIESVRGVNSRSHITSLLARGMIKTQGFRPVPGRPVLYVTTRKFLQQFALNNLTDLPALEEIKELQFDELE